MSEVPNEQAIVDQVKIFYEQFLGVEDTARLSFQPILNPGYTYLITATDGLDRELHTGVAEKTLWEFFGTIIPERIESILAANSEARVSLYSEILAKFDYQRATQYRKTYLESGLAVVDLGISRRPMVKVSAPTGETLWENSSSASPRTLGDEHVNGVENAYFAIGNSKITAWVNL